jgi:hypothetical protein
VLKSLNKDSRIWRRIVEKVNTFMKNVIVVPVKERKKGKATCVIKRLAASYGWET